MEEIKNIISKLAVGKKVSEQDVKRIVLGKNYNAIEKITKRLEQNVNLAAAIKSQPKILKEVIKNKAISEIFKYYKKKK